MTLIDPKTEIMARVSFESMNRFGMSTNTLRISGLNLDDFDNEDYLEDDANEPDFGGADWDEVLPIRKLDSLYEEISERPDLDKSPAETRKTQDFLTKLKSQR